MHEAGLYYTFSTIAQTLAAAFAVLAAFVLFRLTNAEQAFLQLDRRFSAVLGGHPREELWRLVTEEAALD